YSKRTLGPISSEGVVQDHALDTIVLDPAGTISGRVICGARDLVGAIVTVERVGTTAVTNQRGEIVLRDVPAGSQELLVRYQILPKQKARSPVELAPGAFVTKIDIPMTGYRTVQGAVQDLGGKPVPGAIVGVNGEVGDPVIANPDGTFEIDLPNEDL